MHNGGQQIMATYRERLNYGEMAKDTIEIGGGFILSGFTGRLIEEKLRPFVTPTSPTSDKVIAGAANNLPKVGLYYIFNKIGMKGAAAAAMGSLGYDVLIRATNQGINPASIYVKNYRVLNPQPQNGMPQSMQPTQSIPDWAERQKQFGAMPFREDHEITTRQDRFGAMPFRDNPDILERQRKYAQMPFRDNPDILERQRKYGAMPFEQPAEKTNRQHKYGFAGMMEKMGFVPDAKDTSIAKMFNMQ